MSFQLHGEVILDEFDHKQFIEFCIAYMGLRWSEVEDPDGDPSPRSFVYLQDPYEKLWACHVHEIDHSWFSTRPRVHELSSRVALFADLAPCRFIALATTGIVLSYESPDDMPLDVASRIHDERRAMLVEHYGSLTHAWKAGEQDVHEVAQVVCGSAEGPAVQWSAKVIRQADAPPLLGEWEPADTEPSGNLIDPIQEALRGT